MKLALDERMKHRLAGVIVIVAMSIIFLPDLLKTHGLKEDRVNLSLRLPAKPKPPVVAIPNQQEVFKTMKVAHVTIPTTPVVNKATPSLAKAETLMPKVKTVATTALPVLAQLDKAPIAALAVKSNITLDTKNSAKNTKKKINDVVLKTVKSKPTPLQVHGNLKIKNTIPSQMLSKQIVANVKAYKVQLAAFSQEKNAIALVKDLQKKGYVTSYYKSGSLYHVLVGQVQQKSDAIILQKKLVAQLQLDGFIVHKGLS